MSRIVYVYADKALASQGATVSAASEADASFPKENAITGERGRVWKTSASPASTVTLDILLSTGAGAITGFGVMNLVCSGTSPAVDIRSGSSFGGATSRATKTTGYFTGAVKDWCDVFSGGGSFSDRYWRIQFTSVTAQFYVGKIILGTGKDFGRLYSKDSGYSVVPAMSDTRTVDQEPVLMPFGPPRKTFQYNHATNTDAERIVFETIALEPSSWMGLVDSTDACNHVRLSSVQFKHVFMSNWDVSIEMEQVP